MPLVEKQDVQKLKEQRKQVQMRMNLARANLSSKQQVVSEVINQLAIQLNRLDHAIAAAETDFTPNPPGVAARRAAELSGACE